MTFISNIHLPGLKKLQELNLLKHYSKYVVVSMFSVEKKSLSFISNTYLFSL